LIVSERIDAGQGPIEGRCLTRMFRSASEVPRCVEGIPS
jgi:hypothetical protein